MGSCSWEQVKTKRGIRLGSSLSLARRLGAWKTVGLGDGVYTRGRGHQGPRLGVAGILRSAAPSSKYDTCWGRDFSLESGLPTPPSS